MIVVTLPTAVVTWQGPETWSVDLDLGWSLDHADPDPNREERIRREELDRVRAEVDRALSRPAYVGDPEDDGPWRLLPGTGAHAKAALLSLPGAEIEWDDA